MTRLDATRDVRKTCAHEIQTRAVPGGDITRAMLRVWSGWRVNGASTADIADLDWHAQASIKVHAQLKHVVNIPLKSLSRRDQGAIHRASEDRTSGTRHNAIVHSEKYLFSGMLRPTSGRLV